MKRLEKTLEFEFQAGGGASEELAEFLAGRMGVSKNRAKGLLDRRRVWVNDCRVWMARHRLRKGDIVRILPDSPAASVRVIYEDDALLVVDKPAGLLSNGEASAESLIRSQRGEPGLRAAHRLDRDTSGCLLIARNDAAYRALEAAFRGHAVGKKYHALVHGNPGRPEFRVSAPVDGLTATTRVRVVDSVPGAAHVIASIETGRTHQIRRHLASVRHPVIGDSVYAPPRLHDPRFREVPRQMLHSSEIALPHPATGARIRAASPLPADFRRCMKLLGLT